VQAHHEGPITNSKYEINQCRTLSEIKLKRTDTTLDLSQNGKESWRREEKKVQNGAVLLKNKNKISPALDPGDAFSTDHIPAQRNGKACRRYDTIG
jgi:hypothetical protein